MLARTITLGAALALTGLTAACSDDYYYDRPGRYSYYNGNYGQPYWGWYGDYYYPGTGVYVYDRYRAPRRWTYGEQRYWADRQRGWRGGAFHDEWRGFRHVPRGYRR